MKKWLVLLIIGTSLILAACGSEQTYETIDISEVETYQGQGSIVVDVREPNEYSAGHIPGAMNKPLSEISTGDYEGLDSSETYVIICQSGNRSQQASEVLNKEGFTLVNVDQGMSSWSGELE